MREIRLHPAGQFGRHFIPEQYLPPGEDEYHLRNRQSPKPSGYWRHLRSDEIETLVKNAVSCDDWDSVFVADPFRPQLVRNCEFFGLIRIGRLENVVLEHHELQVPAGISNSTVISCDLGDNVGVHNVRYLAHYIVGNHVLLLNIDEMNTTNHAKFGNGVVKEGEPEDVRIWLDLMNEAGGRSVLPFDGMTAADAYLWARYRDDPKLQSRLREITQRQFDARRGYYGTVGDASVIKNCQIVKDVKIGPHCYIKGANKLKNLTINSSDAEPTQIGEGVEMVNGIVGLGCHVFYGCKAVRFVMANNTALKYGARLIHSYLGDNSTVSCCEILNNLIFPAHEQHHNNSFLVAALVMGQSNIAAGATLGSNHNSRANDGEIQAGRGFWPGLCTTLKHSCRFASYVLLAKGDYPAELDVRLPFSLVSNDAAADRLLVAPAFWWLHNTYALARNSWKFHTRDMRKTKSQHVEFDYLAPDTAEEMFAAMRLLEIWTARAYLTAGEADETETGRSRESGRPPATASSQPRPVAVLSAGKSEEHLARLGRELFFDAEDKTANLEVLGANMENLRRPTVVLKARKAYFAYRDMLHLYAVKNLLEYVRINSQANLAAMCETLAGRREREWVNLGGQLVSAAELKPLLAAIKSGKLDSWPAIHAAYDGLWADYPRQKQRHAYHTLLELLGVETLDVETWRAALDEAVRIQQYVRDQVYESRAKDYRNPFRQTTFRNADEMQAVLGTIDDNSFVKLVRKETQEVEKLVKAVKERG